MLKIANCLFLLFFSSNDVHLAFKGVAKWFSFSLKKKERKKILFFKYKASLRVLSHLVNTKVWVNICLINLANWQKNTFLHFSWIVNNDKNAYMNLSLFRFCYHFIINWIHFLWKFLKLLFCSTYFCKLKSKFLTIESRPQKPKRT